MLKKLDADPNSSLSLLTSFGDLMALGRAAAPAAAAGVEREMRAELQALRARASGGSLSDTPSQVMAALDLFAAESTPEEPAALAPVALAEKLIHGGSWERWVRGLRPATPSLCFACRACVCV